MSAWRAANEDRGSARDKAVSVNCDISGEGSRTRHGLEI